MRNNKEIYSGGSQKLSDEDIRRLKESGLKGEDLIKTIMENNTSMQKRTIFSQEKMLKKKKIKHLHKIWIVETNLFNIVETLFLENERSINYMRADTFSTILVHSNFFNNAKTIILEDIDNILTSAFTLRSGNKSNIVSLYQSKLNNKNLSIFNFSFEKKNLITYMNYESLINPSGFFYKTLCKNFLLSFDKYT
jgi:tRNA (adenine-N(1)-)-methyltransferase non-catalytic subunit